MPEGHVLVLGSVDECATVVRSLGDRGLAAWWDSLDGALCDPVSLNWADALVIVAPEELADAPDNANSLPPDGFRGPALLAAASANGDAVAELIERGFDAVLPWPSSPEVIAAFVVRMLDADAPRAG